MKSNKVALAAAVACVVGALCAGGRADTVTVYATQGKDARMDLTSSSVAGQVQSESRLKTRSSTNTNDKSWLQFDLSAVYAANPGLQGHIATATLTFTGTGANAETKSYVVNGLNDAAGLEGWSSASLTWNNAPGNNTASSTALNPALTTADLYTGSIAPGDGSTDTRSSAALTAFLNTDTDGLVTFIMTPGGTAYFYNAGSAHPPALTLSRSTEPESPVPAFPGAEGYGAIASGGRGGAVFEVTNLNDSGTGSLRWALQQNTARTIVFRVSGTIYLLSNLNTTYPNLTIAGQTAPGDGITLAGAQLVVNSSNVIIRYIRCRLGDVKIDGTQTADSDSIGGLDQDRIIIDHVSASWSSDETFSFYRNTNFTAQWCMITESMRYNHHVEEGVLQNHGYGGIWGGVNTSWHHNLLAHHDSRNPRWSGEVGVTADHRDNVIYNWGGNSCYGGEHVSVNMVNNYYKWGPATVKKYRVANPSYQLDGSGNPIVPHVYGQWYITNNYVDGYPAVTADNWNGGVNPQGGDAEQPLCRSYTEFPAATRYPVSEQPAQTAYNYVLAGAGCSLSRDWVDTRIIREVRTRTATYGDSYGAGTGIIDSQASVGGWPQLDSAPAPADSDHDGMPDAWETANGLNPSDASDRNGHAFDPNYTNLEVYINSLCPDPYGPDYTPPTPEPMTFAVPPYSPGGYSITMTATAASDASGVEYYFMCVGGGGHSSGWQDSPVYTDAGLTEGVLYSYRVKARDKSSLHNTTESSAEFSATALRYSCGSPQAADFNADCEVDFLDLAVLAGPWAGDPVDWQQLAAFAEEWLVCHRSPADECWR
jgi:hypothetical protein